MTNEPKPKIPCEVCGRPYKNVGQHLKRSKCGPELEARNEASKMTEPEPDPEPTFNLEDADDIEEEDEISFDDIEVDKEEEDEEEEDEDTMTGRAPVVDEKEKERLREGMVAHKPEPKTEPVVIEVEHPFNFKYVTSPRSNFHDPEAEFHIRAGGRKALPKVLSNGIKKAIKNGVLKLVL